MRRDLGCAHRCPGEELSLGDGWQCSCYFHDSKNNMALEEHLRKAGLGDGSNVHLANV